MMDLSKVQSVAHGRVEKLRQRWTRLKPLIEKVEQAVKSAPEQVDGHTSVNELASIVQLEQALADLEKAVRARETDQPAPASAPAQAPAKASAKAAARRITSATLAGAAARLDAMVQAERPVKREPVCTITSID